MSSRQKADFKARREMLGLSQQLMADMLNVSVRSVKRWEHPGQENMPPDDAWCLLEELEEQQKWVVSEAMKRAILIDADYEGSPEKVDLTYWFSYEEFEEAHPGQGWGWQMANANSRLVAWELRRQGYEVEFGFGGLRSMGLDVPDGF